MSDPFRQVSTRRVPPFPRSDRPLSTRYYDRPYSATLQQSQSLMATLTSDNVKTYLSCHHQVLQDYVMENVSMEQLVAWMRDKEKKEKSNSKLSVQHNGMAVTQQVFCKQDIQSVEKSLNEELSKAADCRPYIFQMAHVIASTTSSDGFTVYSVTSDGTELSICLPGKELGTFSTKCVGPVGTGTTVAAHVAKTKTSLLTKDLIGDVRFPQGVGIEESLVHSVLCVPVVLPSGFLLYVMEFTKSWDYPPHTDEDLQITTAVLSLLGIAMHQCQVSESLRRQSELNDFLLEFSKNLFNDVIIFDGLISKIMTYTKDLVHAERCSLFLVDREKNEMYSDFFDEGTVDSAGRPTFVKSDRIRFPVTKGIAGHVAVTGEIVNIPDAYSDPRFNREIDKKTGFTTKNILCMPILCHGAVIGVVQMINKKNSSRGFSSTDEESFKLFAVFCSLALHYSKVYNEVNKQRAQFSVAMEQLGYHLTCREEKVKTLLKEPLVNPPPEDLDNYGFYPGEAYGDKLHKLFIQLVHNLFGPDMFNLETLCRFTLTVQNNYRIVPYHNWNHGFMVAHSIYCMLRRIKGQGLFSCIQEQALLFGAICHDLDHRGFNNAYFVKFEEPLAHLYSSSVMEQHHYAHMVLILQQIGHNVFQEMSSEDYQEFLECAKFCIISTDLSLYFSNQKELSQKVLAETLDLTIPEHKSSLMALMMTAADLCAVCKPWPSMKREVFYLYQEFYTQGDLEKEKGENPIPMMDRTNEENLPQDQVGFITHVCMPCYTTLAQILPETKGLLQGCQDSLYQWERVKEGRSTLVWEPAKSLPKSSD